MKNFFGLMLVSCFFFLGWGRQASATLEQCLKSECLPAMDGSRGSRCYTNWATCPGPGMECQRFADCLGPPERRVKIKTTDPTVVVNGQTYYYNAAVKGYQARPAATQPAPVQPAIKNK